MRGDPVIFDYNNPAQCDARTVVADRYDPEAIVVARHGRITVYAGGGEVIPWEYATEAEAEAAYWELVAEVTR